MWPKGGPVHDGYVAKVVGLREAKVAMQVALTGPALQCLAEQPRQLVHRLTDLNENRRGLSSRQLLIDVGGYRDKEFVDGAHEFLAARANQPLAGAGHFLSVPVCLSPRSGDARLEGTCTLGIGIVEILEPGLAIAA